MSPRHGKKPGGKTAGKGTKPRTVVRGARGLIPMEIDAAGDQHIAGRLPDSAVADEANDGDEEDEDEDEDEGEGEERDEGPGSMFEGKVDMFDRLWCDLRCFGRVLLL